MTSLDGATVLVTGANGGLGAEFVRQAIDRGARRVYAAARQPRGWDDERVVPLLLDVTDAADIQEAARSAGDTTVLINNAGIIVPGRILDTAIDEVRSVFETNVFGLVAVSQAFAPLLRNGAILNVASALSWLAIPGSYSASKAAVWAASNTLRLELAEQNTQVLTLHLNYTDTPMTARLTVAKNRPEDVVAAAYDGLEKGANEVLTDETTRHIRGALSAPVEELYPQLSTGV